MAERTGKRKALPMAGSASFDPKIDPKTYAAERGKKGKYAVKGCIKVVLGANYGEIMNKKAKGQN